MGETPAASKMAWPNNNVAQLMQGEAVSNGGWIAALSTVFPCPRYILAPEVRMQPLRLDFAVVDVIQQGAFLAFEGKGAGFNWDNLTAEVRDSCIAIRPQGFQGYTYGVGGNGPHCILVEWDGAQLRYLYRDNGGQLNYSENLRTFHIVNDQATITFILQQIRAAH